MNSGNQLDTYKVIKRKMNEINNRMMKIIEKEPLTYQMQKLFNPIYETEDPKEVEIVLNNDTCTSQFNWNRYTLPLIDSIELSFENSESNINDRFESIIVAAE